ncbi:MAG: TIGR03905 family TSCPD domain-containing protein [Clostridia bacterium]|nr:TIGR03905 family TSCPD domain-containing protein [Clostridia bacterium]
MEQFTYTPHGVCSRAIDIAIENGIIQEVRYHGGCAGNTQGVSALIKGMRIEDAIERLSGIRCGFKSTSCPDQLANALREYLARK